jgi:transcriptional regulator with XRE-family HTH domain
MRRPDSPLRAARERAGYTIREFSKITGISTGHLSMIERGMASPSEAEALRLASALGLPADDGPPREAAGNPLELSSEGPGLDGERATLAG